MEICAKMCSIKFSNREYVCFSNIRNVVYLVFNKSGCHCFVSICNEQKYISFVFIQALTGTGCLEKRGAKR